MCWIFVKCSGRFQAGDGCQAIYARLCEEVGFTGGYASVYRVVRRLEPRARGLRRENSSTGANPMTRIAALWLVAVISLSLSAQTQGKTHAQKLVDETVAKHPDVLVLAMHVTPPNSSKNVIIASNIGRIGKEADEDDLRVISTGKPNLEVNKTGDRFEVELVLQDASGKTIGALGVVFPYKAGDKKSELQKRAERIRDDLRKQIPTLANLFEVP